MLFINTKNPTIICDFKQAVIKPVIGNDGGIFVPSFIPKLGQQEIEQICNNDYKEILIDIILLYWKECKDINIIKQLVDNALSGFNKNFQDDEKQKQHRYFDGFVSVDKFDQKQKIVNLTYGPTGNVKDYGNFLTAEFINYFAQQDNINFTIIDCEGSNSIVSTAYAVNEKTNLQSFLIFNDDIKQNDIGLLSLLQKKNLEFISISNDISFFEQIKQNIMSNKSFQEIKNLSFINGLNILNILAYIPVFFILYAKCHFKPFCVSIPTNNMGLAMSAFLAHKMGIPINKIIMCIEKNTFLLKFQEEKIVLNNNIITYNGFSGLSSSIPSNFERLLFYLYGSNQMSVKRSLEELKKCNTYKVNDSFIHLFLEYFYVVQTDNLFKIQNCIYSVQQENNIITDFYFAMSRIGYNNAMINIGDEISNSPVILFNTMNYKRNIKFINDTLGYELMNITQPFTKENINTFQPTRIENNEESLLKYIINFDF